MNVNNENELTKDIYKSLLLAIEFGIIATDLNLKVIFLNKTGELLTGWSQIDAIGKDISLVFEMNNELTNETISQLFNEVINTGESKKIYRESILVSKKGFDTPISDNITAMLTNDEKVIGAILVFRDHSDQIQKQNELEFINYHDQLTGVYNRRYYKMQLENMMIKDNLPLSLIMCDVNGLKLINDAFGHKAGDELLKKVATTMQTGCRANDVITRIGGDEFVIILPKTNEIAAKMVIERINILAKFEKVENLDISISFGSGTKTKPEEDIVNIFKRAEDDMYESKLNSSTDMRKKTIQMIIKKLNEKSVYEKKHADGVSILCKNFAQQLNFAQDLITELELAGKMHDIGKINVSSLILNKPSSLSLTEWKEMKRHSEIGYRILSSLNEYSDIAEHVLQHHENYNGSGYPKGLKEKEITAQARILRIADAYDAMTRNHSYKTKLTKREAINEMRTKSGIDFDPDFLELFINKVI
ncbi:MAG: diguanylate cyclase [Candidatus Izemoplasma sp.]